MNRYEELPQKMRDTYSPALIGAVLQLNRLIDEGWEYPDAEWKISQKSGFSRYELQRAYDMQYEKD